MIHTLRALALPLVTLTIAGCSGGASTPEKAAGAQVDKDAVATAGRSETGRAAEPAVAPGTVRPQHPVTDPPAETALAQIPARFVGTWAPDKRACAGDYAYQPTFQRVFIERDRVGFFETSGDVQAVAEAGGSTRVTVRERVGDAYPVYPILISLADGGQALNYIRDGERRQLVKCSDSTAR